MAPEVGGAVATRNETHDVDAAIDDQGHTALHLAAYLGFGFPELLARGAAVDAVAAQDGLGPYKRLRGGKRNPKIIKPRPQDPPALPLHRFGGRTPLSYAVEGFQLAAVISLLEAAADPCRADTGGASPLTLALERRATANFHGQDQAAAEEVAEVVLAAVRRSGQGALVPRSPPTEREALERRHAREIQMVRRIQKAEAEKRVVAEADGLLRIASEYTPSYPGIYSPPWPGLCAVPAEPEVPILGVAVFQLLTPDFAAALWAELASYEAAAKAQGLPYHVRFDGNWDCQENCGFRGLLEAMNAAIAPSLAAIGEAPGIFAHAVRLDNYADKPGADNLALKVHEDKYRLTINLGLCVSEDLEGSGVGFYVTPTGTQRTSVEPERVYTYIHRPGFAIVHSGKFLHKTDPIVRGRRGSMILWCS